MDRAIIMPDGNKYLEVKYRIADFKRDFPEGRFEALIEKSGPAWVLFKARVYKNSSSKPAAEAHAYRKYSELSPHYFEEAETSAIGRALADLGYDLPYMMAKAGGAMEDFAIDTDDGFKYLQPKFRVAFFRLDEPDGYIKKEIVESDELHAIAKASVFNGDGVLLAVGHARRDWAMDTEAGEYFLEAAETAAAGRALAFLGYDLPPDVNHSSDIEETPLSAAPAPAPDMDGVVAPPESLPDATLQEPDGFPANNWDYEPQAPAEEHTPMDYLPYGPDDRTEYNWDYEPQEPADLNTAEDAAIPEPVTAAKETPASSAGLFDSLGLEQFEFISGQGKEDGAKNAAAEPTDSDGQMSLFMNPPETGTGLEEARSMVLGFGPNEGKTLGEIAGTEKGAEYLNRLVLYYKKDPELVEAAKLVLAS